MAYRQLVLNLSEVYIGVCYIFPVIFIFFNNKSPVVLCFFKGILLTRESI